MMKPRSFPKLLVWPFMRERVMNIADQSSESG
jgi:hypothetical protein